MSKFKVGDIIKGEVTGVTKYGVFVSLEEDYSGLVHISEVSSKYVNNLTNRFMIGDIINVKVLEIDEEKCHVKLSIKKINYKVKIGKSVLEESGLGFELLDKNLPKWIEEGMKNLVK